MSDLSKILLRISDLKQKVLKDSISPYYLGSILEDMLGHTWTTGTGGNFDFESLKAGTLEVGRLIVDQLLALDTDTILTESDIIESVTDNTDGTYTLTLLRRFPGYVTAQIEHNILRGFSQNIIPPTDNGQPPTDNGQQTTENGQQTTENGQPPTDNAFARQSWMNVLSVDYDANEITVTLYPDSDIPTGKNFPPLPGMKFARWGNSGDSSDPRYAQRQTCVWLSSSEGTVSKYINVTRPRLFSGNYAATFGTFPDFLTGLDPRVAPGDQGIFADTVVARRVIILDSLDRPVATVIDRGPWTPGEMYYDGSVPNFNGIYERSLVWYNGHGWLANTTGAAELAYPPRWNATHWTHSIGDTALHLDFNEVDSLVDLDSPQCPLSVSATYIGEDVTSSPAIYYDWTRQSSRGGSEDTASDTIWNENHRNFGPSALLTAADMNFQFGAPPDKLLFTVTAHLHSSDNPAMQPGDQITSSAQLLML